MVYEDIYFLSPQTALEIASQQNRWGENDYYLQACYYDGEIIESEFENLIHLSLDTLVENLAEGIYRIPSKLNFDGLDISGSLKLDILTNFNLSIEHAHNYRSQYNKYYFEKLGEMKLDFNEPLRFHIMASTSTKVMQHVAKTIVDELKEMGYSVFFDLRIGTMDDNCLREVLKFNPHVTININHLNNSFLSDDVFNFVWYQDPMPALLDDTKMNVRRRDFFYSLVPDIDNLLMKKGLSFERQNFCVNKDIYKSNDSIKRENKIVFIGSSYSSQIPESKDFSQLIEYVTERLFSEEILTYDETLEISQKYDVDMVFLETRLIPFIVRDLSVIQLCRLKSNYKIEVYGFGWEIYDEIKPYFKGSLKYGNDISRVYNNATYAFCPHSGYILQQRVLEASASGAIPIVYDCKDLFEEGYEEALVYFKTFHDLENILLEDETPQKDFTRLLNDSSYRIFIDKILGKIREG